MKMNPTIEEVHEAIRLAAKSISDTRSDIWHTSEWNICHHLAKELASAFDAYDVDVELVKDDKRRPDMVIHQNGNNTNNLAVFQVKINPSTADLTADIEKIRGTFFRKPYQYQYGLLVSIGKLPDIVPEFDPTRIRILEVDGYRLMTDKEFAKERKRRDDEFKL